MPHTQIAHALVLKIVGMSSLLGAGVVAVDPQLVGEVNQMPITIALILLCAITMCMAFRMAEKSRQTADKQADNIGSLAGKIDKLADKIHNVVYVKDGRRRDDVEIGHVE